MAVAKKTVAKKPAASRAAAPAPRQQNLPARVKGSEVVDTDMQNAMAGDAGRGVSTAASDNIVPLIYVLQAQSPQVLKQKQEYIKDAEAGMFWMRGTKETVDGEEGIPVILCHMGLQWIEWRPNRGGFVGRHGPERPEEAQWVKDPKNPKKGQWELQNGNYVAETREHAVLRADTGEAYVIPFSGSNHGPARQWMTDCNRKRVPGTDLKAPVYGYVYRLKTIPKTNDEGDWFGITVENGGDEGAEMLTWNLPNGPVLYKLAKQLNSDVKTGAKQSDQGEEQQCDSSDGEDQEDIAA